MKILIRAATAHDDFAAVAELNYQSWLETYPGLIPPKMLEKLSPANWQPQKRWQHMFLALTSDGQPVGEVTFGVSRNPADYQRGELYSLYLLQKYQHQGIGAELFQLASDFLTKTYPNNYLWVLSNNQSAQHFYQQQGLLANGDFQIARTPDGQLHETRYVWPTQ